MKDVSKQLNETKAENQLTKINNSTLEENQTGSNSIDKNSNGTVKEENSPLLEGYLNGNGTAENSGL